MVKCERVVLLWAEGSGNGLTASWGWKKMFDNADWTAAPLFFSFYFPIAGVEVTIRPCNSMQ